MRAPDCWCRGRVARRLWVVLLLLFACLPAIAQPAASSATDTRLLQVEGAFLVNFLRYTDWPPPRLGETSDPYVVTVVGSPDAADAVAAVAAAAGDIRGRRVQVRRASMATAADRASAADVLRTSHLVFVQASAQANVDTVLDTVRDLPILTVSDTPGFAASGGMLGLVQSRAHLAFEANPAAIRNAGLMVSAKVLKLATLRGVQR